MRPALPDGTTGPVLSGIAGKCLDNAQNGSANGNPVTSYQCNNSPAQTWYFDGQNHLGINYKCVAANGTANGTKAALAPCDGSARQVWRLGPDDSLIHQASGRCLDVPDSSTTDGVQLQLYECNGSTAQRWSVPQPTA
jgi:hypothetical protein